ncbi:MAG: flagellar hook-basal body complex protein FliE [Planctomycetota bacterium]
MSDPLGLINNSTSNINGPARAFGVRPPHAGGPQPGPGEVDPNSPNFKSMVMDELREVNRLQQEATEAIEDLSTGQRNDFENVMIATKKADLAFEMLLGVRNKVMDAYNEVKQIRV